ncbi:hypothetical protein GCM10023318_04080 [Nocardia callitridis]|uniref:Uncharacterized protein n=1 Tax=Nocardia callitridis TaxID=648753 RepID=A0ABP9JS34_9NOCA
MLYNGAPVADTLILGHENERTRLAYIAPAAAHIGVVAGDPAYDRMLLSRHLRMRYRQELGVAPGQILVTLCTTWSHRSLFGSWPSLFRETLACLPRDRYRVAGLIHPNTSHGHGEWQVGTWHADALRAGLLLTGPAEGWQATLIASDLVIGDHGATTCYGAALDLPVLLAAFPDTDVARGSVGAILGATAPRLHRFESLATQIHRTIAEYEHGTFDELRALMSSHPGEAILRLRAECYSHLGLSVPGTPPVTPVIPPHFLGAGQRTHTRECAAHTDYAVCTPLSRDAVAIDRYPAGVDVDRSEATYLDDAFLVAHENHPWHALTELAPVVITDEPAVGQDARELLDETLRRFPSAQVVATNIGETCLVRTRTQITITISTADAGIAAIVVYSRLIKGQTAQGEVAVQLGSAHTSLFLKGFHSG